MSGDGAGPDDDDGEPEADAPAGRGDRVPPDARTQGHPIDGNALMVAAAKASVGAGRLPALLRRAHEHLADRAAEYDRAYERVHEAAGVGTYLVPEGHWAEVGETLELSGREADALRRAHDQHLLRLGTRLDRRREFESALEVREAAVVPVPDGRNGSDGDADDQPGD